MSDDDFLDDESLDEAFEEAKDREELPTPAPSEKRQTLDKVHLKDVSLKVHLELARIKVTLEELQKMQPGYRLPIDINPRLVDFVVNGKSIGKGELVEVGDTIGIKILELYT